MKTFLNSIRIISLAAVLAVGVSYVFAFTEPTTNPPANTAAPIHTGESVQQKTGGIWSKKVLVAPVSIFKKSIFLPGNKSALRIGSNDNATGDQTFTKGSAGAIAQDLNTAVFGETDTVPLVIDLYSRPQPQDAIEFKTDQLCPIVTRFTNDKAASFEFKKEDGSRANIIARQVRLTGGDPDANDVLVSDADGNARWAKASVVNGQVVFSSGVSPVPAGQCIYVTPPVVHTCPTGQSWDDTLNSCSCNSGIREGQVPNTAPITQTGKIIQYINTVNQNPGGSGAPIVPYYVLLEELRRNGGPGNSCQIIAMDNACPQIDLDTVNAQASFTLNGVTYRTSGGNSWTVNSTVGDQCIMNQQAQVNGQDLIMYNIE